MLAEGASGAADGVVGETYDVTMPASWGADGTWDNGAIVQNTVISAGAGGLLHNVGAPAHGGADVPTSGSADPQHGQLAGLPGAGLAEPDPVALDGRLTGRAGYRRTARAWRIRPT